MPCSDIRFYSGVHCEYEHVLRLHVWWLQCAENNNHWRLQYMFIVHYINIHQCFGRYSLSSQVEDKESIHNYSGWSRPQMLHDCLTCPSIPSTVAEISPFVLLQQPCRLITFSMFKSAKIITSPKLRQSPTLSKTFNSMTRDPCHPQPVTGPTYLTFILPVSIQGLVRFAVLHLPTNAQPLLGVRLGILRNTGSASTTIEGLRKDGEEIIPHRKLDLKHVKQ
jgi:hypothetical protein